MKNLAPALLLASVCSLPLPGWAQSLCSPTETQFFNCPVGTAGKVLSVCGSLKGKKYLQYRFGTPAKIELAFPPEKGPESFSRFSLSRDYRQTAGTTTRELAFAIASYNYVVAATSHPLGEEANPAYSRFGGVSVAARTGKATEISCTGEVKERFDLLEDLVASR